jgi:hypothetical protein
MQDILTKSERNRIKRNVKARFNPDADSNRINRKFRRTVRRMKKNNMETGALTPQDMMALYSLARSTPHRFKRAYAWARSEREYEEFKRIYW